MIRRIFEPVAVNATIKKLTIAHLLSLVQRVAHKTDNNTPVVSSTATCPAPSFLVSLE